MRWTENKIYETDKNGCGLVSDDGDNGFVNVVNFTMKIQGVEFVEVTQFTKADLKPCMVVILRNSHLYMVGMTKNGEICLDRMDGYRASYWKELKDDMRSSVNNDFDIVKVYSSTDYASNCHILSTSNRELLWERIEKSPQQIKLEELENKQREIADEIRKIREGI
jgi:hypothetical protein